jgi:capsular exopolysaccharide synthesis family protein
MMHRDDDSSPIPSSQHAMIGGPHPPGDALVVQSNGAPTGLAVHGTPTAAPHDVLRGGMDANTLLNALRRRWLLAGCIGLVMAIIASSLLWMNFPASSSATALFRVSSEQESIFTDINKQSPQAYEILKKTQLALLKSYFVLQAAVRKPGVASLSALAGEEPVEWLMENVDVGFPQQGEILSISISSDEDTADLVRLVDAVALAYNDEVVYKERSRQLATRDLLSRSLENINKEIADKWEVYIDIARESERPQATQRDAQTELLLQELANMQKKRVDLEAQMLQMQNEYAILKGRLENPAMLEMQVEESLQQDPYMASLNQQLMMVQASQAQVSGVSRRQNAATAGMDRKVADLQNKIAQYRAQAIAQSKRDAQTKPNLALSQLTSEFRTNFNSVRQQHAYVMQGFEKAMTALNKRIEKSVELDTRGRELEQLQKIADDMSMKFESLEIEAQAPQQIEQVQKAVGSPGNSKAQQITISAMGGMMAFALSCLAVGYVEFRNRRLDGPEQVDEGLGIRVIGTLPSLSSRHALDPAHPIVAQLTESIDGVRTILMHDSTSKRRQVVLVTSAATMEGRTTVASQLAASLARAGRRTLLVDGDLRRPALHALFDVPLEDGLCEVLRAEVDVDDVIRPTHAEGLWLLTAGYCDIDAIHALATEQMQPVFDKLRTEYDFVIIDGAPILGMSDALIFGQYSDGAILSVRRDHSQMPKINHAAELLRDVGIRIIGAVVNGVSTKADDRIMQLRLIAPKSERELQPTG